MTKPCHNCGDTERIKASAWNGSEHRYFCHDDDRSCYNERRGNYFDEGRTSSTTGRERQMSAEQSSMDFEQAAAYVAALDKWLQVVCETVMNANRLAAEAKAQALKESAGFIESD